MQPTRPKILVVNQHQRNLQLLVEFLSNVGYDPLPASSMEALDQTLDGGSDIGATLVDISGFGQEIWTRCERLRHKRIPFVLIYPNQGPAAHHAWLQYRADGVIAKPLVMQELINLIQYLLKEKEEP
jgi:CheY-like chemotaxis protein